MVSEEKVLRHLLASISSTETDLPKRKLIGVISLLIGVALLITAYFLIPPGLIVGKIAIICAAFGGLLIYFWSVNSVAMQYSSYTKKYLKVTEIEARLNELKT